MQQRQGAIVMAYAEMGANVFACCIIQIMRNFACEWWAANAFRNKNKKRGVVHNIALFVVRKSAKFLLRADALRILVDALVSELMAQQD